MFQRRPIALARAVDTPIVASTAAATVFKPAASGEVSVEERLKRMEEAYLRMEENNRRIQRQYGDLMRQYQDLSRSLKQSGATAATADSPILGDIARRTSESDQNGGLFGVNLADLFGPDPAEDDEGTERVVLQQRVAGAEGEMGRIDRGRDQPAGRQLPSPIPAPDDLVPAPGSVGAQGLIGAEPGAAAISACREWIASEPARKEPTAASAPPSNRRARAMRGEAEIWVYKPDAKPRTHRAVVDFGEGLEFRTDDDEYRLQFHNLTQAEFRGFPTRNQGILQSQFYIPRERWYFTGDLTKNIGFYTVINRGYGSLDLLDAFMTIRFDNRLRFRIGRMKTPYLYEYFSISEGDLIAPERSIFSGNMALNRQMGMMFLGNFFDDRLSYATGIFNGPRRSFQDFNSSKDWIGTLTARPWLTSESFPALKYMNLGGSWDVGYQSNSPPQPTYFETANDQTGGTGALSLSPTFLALNKNVIEQGQRMQWGAHAVWFYKSFFFMAEYGGGRAGYSTTNNGFSTPVNYSGWFLQSSYLLTGEELTRRVSVLQPRRDFNFNWFRGVNSARAPSRFTRDSARWSSGTTSSQQAWPIRISTPTTSGPLTSA